MGIGLVYPLLKRTTPLSMLRPWWHQLHLLLGLLGGSMAVLHSAGRLGKAPTLVLLAALGIMALGLYGRLLAGRLAYRGFAGDPGVFLPADTARPRAALPLIKEKERLLSALEPRASEGTFSLTPGHWLRHPVASAGFALLALQEEQLVLRMRSLSWSPVLLLQRYWRFLHLLLVALLLLGVLAHSIMVLFFAGYIAEGSEPYWWYIRR